MRSSYTDETRVKLKYYKIKINSIKKSDFFYVCPLEKNYNKKREWKVRMMQRKFKINFKKMGRKLFMNSCFQ